MLVWSFAFFITALKPSYAFFYNLILNLKNISFMRNNLTFFNQVRLFHKCEPLLICCFLILFLMLPGKTNGLDNTANNDRISTETNNPPPGPVVTSILPTCYKYCADRMDPPRKTDITYQSDCSPVCRVAMETEILDPIPIAPRNCPGTVYRHWYNVTDDCSNTAPPVYRDVIIQNDGPKITCPPFNLILQCGDPNNLDYIYTHLGLVKATTSCDLGVYIENDFDSYNFDLYSCGQATIVTFTATDVCDRSTTCTTTIAMVDNKKPYFTEIPPAICDVIECGADADFWFDHWINYMENGLKAYDACSGDVAPKAYNAELNTECNDYGVAVTVVTFRATDDCGNYKSITGTFTIKNEHPALFVDVPADATIQCPEAPVFGPDPSVTEECETTVTSEDSLDDSDPCAVKHTRTWTATDACGGLSTSVSQTITVVDTEAPVAPAPPADVNVQCAADVPPPVNLTADDACDGDITVSPSAVITPGDCEDQFVMVRTWTFIDNCGNQSSVSQTITVHDDTPPAFTYVPAGYESGCINDDGIITTYAQICSSSDDAEEDADGGEMNLISSDLEMVIDDSQDKEVKVGLRFKDLHIPAGAKITKAWIQFTADATIDIDPSELTINGFAGDNAMTFSEADHNITSRPKTAATVAWEPADWMVVGDNHEAQRTPDLAAIVQEIVDRAGYTKDSALGFIVCGTGKRTAISYDLNPDQAPEIYVKYEAGNPFGTPTAADNCSNVTITHEDSFDNNDGCAGSITRTWTATDDCGNASTASQTVHFFDHVPPVFTYVPEHVNTSCYDYSYPPTFGTPEVYDNCDDVTVSYVDYFETGDEYSCDEDDEDSDFRRKWTATDGCGNKTTAVQRFNVKDSHHLTGKIYTEKNEPLENVVVSLEGANGFTQVSQTTIDGLFDFEDLTLGQNYSVTPYMNEDPRNGVSSFDMVLIAKHILQMEDLDSPYKMIAADINGSGEVTTLDLLEMRKVLLHVSENFHNNTSWRFVTSDFVFPVSDNPFATTFPEAVNINGLTFEEQRDFVAVKVGDVSGNASSNGFTNADDRNVVDELVFSITDQQLKAGETYDVSFRADNFEAIHGYQFTLNFDQTVVDFAGLNTGELTNLNDNNFGLALLDEGAITTSWTNQTSQTATDDTELFQISFTAKSDVQLSEVIHVGSRYTKAEAYNGNLELMDVELRFEEDEVITNEFRLYQNTPNPFNQETLIGFELPEATKATLNVYDVSGKLLKKVDGDFVKGYNSLSLTKEGLSSGLLYYQLVTPDYTATKKMMVH